ncbi:MAG: aldehyde dehydrogenase family protein, partial [Dehalococcoidia bacterium]|nr:aldehyde dehydrogenase family protein [Dehalococcoidia bacterium]
MPVARLADIPNKPRIETRLFIAGEFVEPSEGKTFSTVYPATNETLAEVAEASRADVERAVQAARSAFDTGPWPRMTMEERAAVLNRLADLLAANLDELARLNTLDNGKTYRESVIDIQTGIGSLRNAASLAPQVRGETLPYDPNLVQFTVREPVGVVAGILPFNAPIVFATGKSAPSMAVGCTIVLKPSPMASLVVLRYAELAREAGVPAGVLNVVTGGNDVASWLAGHPLVDMITLTGSVAAGTRMLELAAPTIKRTLLELGGKSANIVFDDADLDLARAGAMAGIFRNCGQRCFSGSRLLVQKSIYDRFVADLAERAARLRLGDPFGEQTQMGSLISREQLRRVEGFVEGARADGA